ncbi:MAG TPA: glycosyl hydrolase, partial [Hanamia sp.]|nr:glycosyl hydrolase [Hanamia sp.]
NEYISEKSFQKIFDLAKKGATILVYKNLPKDVPGFYKLNERRASYRSLISQLTFTNHAGIKKASVGKGSFLVSDNLEELLKTGGIKQEAFYKSGLQFIRRKNTDGATYFINNRSEKEVNEWVPFNAKATSVAMFDAMNAKSGLADWRKNENGMIEVRIQLKPFESLIVQLFNSKKTGAQFPYLHIAGEAVPVKGEWTITFLSGGPSLPATAKVTDLGSWTSLDGDDYKNFSGTAKYSISFLKPQGNNRTWLLDLGKVNETAEVVLNGKKIATLIGPNFTVAIPSSAMKENNTLEIIVANLMANRIAYMDKNHILWKKFYNTNMPARKRENSKNGLFDASQWEPLPSGLLGPVTITALSLY